jgi:uncharacterized protein DUF6916
MLENLTPADFTQRLGTKFRLRLAEAQAIELELTQVTPFDYGEIGPRREPFSLVFRGPRKLLLPQRTFHLEHDEMPALDLFLVPIGPDAQGLCYEAVFN